MDWASSIGPAVIAAAVSGIVATIGFVVNRSTTLATHREKIDADRKLAERKVEADIALARAKFDYDRAQSIFRRKFELAEMMLSDAYQFRSLMEYVRNGFSTGGEADARIADTMEPENIKRARDGYFVPQARLQHESKFLAEMFARKTACHAHFGEDAAKAFDIFHRAMQQTRVASQLLIEFTTPHDKAEEDTIKKLHNDIWQLRAKYRDQDEIGEMIEQAVKIVEQLCQPVLSFKTDL